jgi:hypothetical protein
MIVLATSTFTVLTLLVVLALIMFAAVLFLVNNYYFFIDNTAPASRDRGPETDQSDVYPGASEDYRYFSVSSSPAWIEDDGFSDTEAQEEPAGEDARASSNSQARRPQSYYYQQPADQQGRVPRIFPVLTAGILALSTALAAAIYWRQR